MYEDMSVKEVLELLIKKHFNGVVVFNKADTLVGVFCIQDVTAAIVPVEIQENAHLADAMYKEHFFQEMCAKIKNKKVKDVMRREFLTVELETSVMKVAAEFLTTNVYVFPVVENEKVIGIITRSEIKKALAHGMEISA